MTTPTKPWVDGPYKLIETPSHRVGSKKPDPSLFAPDSMALIHNALIRVLNAIVLQAKGVSKPKDISDFGQYGIAFCQCLHFHHENEEKLFFGLLEKALNKPGIMDPNLEQHKAFHDQGEIFEEYCRQIKADPSKYSADKMLELAKKFGDILVPHMTDEIETLIDLKNHGDPDGSISKKCMDDWEEKALALADKQVEYPLVLGSNDVTYEGGMHAWWPPVPFFVPYLVNWVFARKHQGAWRFSPCYTMKPRDLQFLPKEQ